MNNTQALYVSFRTIREDAIWPQKGSEEAAGYDLFAVDSVRIPPSSRFWVSTGIIFNIPRHLYGQIKPRSGLASKGIDIGAGVIDPDYQGDVKILLINNSGSDFVVNKGDKIAQIIFIRILNQRRMYPIDLQLPKTQRGASGFGSTGIRSLGFDTVDSNQQFPFFPSTSMASQQNYPNIPPVPNRNVVATQTAQNLAPFQQRTSLQDEYIMSSLNLEDDTQHIQYA